MTDARKELIKILFDKFGFTDVDVNTGDWRAIRLVECADAILKWHNEKTEPISKLWERLKPYDPNLYDKYEDVEYIKSMLLDICKVLKSFVENK
jgi:hypothetical protein